MKIRKYILNLCDFFIESIGNFSSMLLPILVVIISVTVILRYFFSIGFVWLQDLYIWIHATLILLGIAYTLKHDGHVRIDLIYRNSSEKYKNFVNILGGIFFAIPLSYVLIFKGFEYFFRSFLLNESSKESGGLPGIFILKFFIFFMGVTLLVQVISQILKILKKNGNN